MGRCNYREYERIVNEGHAPYKNSKRVLWHSTKYLQTLRLVPFFTMFETKEVRIARGPGHYATTSSLICAAGGLKLARGIDNQQNVAPCAEAAGVGVVRLSDCPAF